MLQGDAKLASTPTSLKEDTLHAAIREGFLLEMRPVRESREEYVFQMETQREELKGAIWLTSTRKIVREEKQARLTKRKKRLRPTKAANM